jgi:hypothetical protein
MCLVHDWLSFLGRPPAADPLLRARGMLVRSGLLARLALPTRLALLAWLALPTRLALLAWLALPTRLSCRRQSVTLGRPGPGPLSRALVLRGPPPGSLGLPLRLALSLAARCGPSFLRGGSLGAGGTARRRLDHRALSPIPVQHAAASFRFRSALA